MSELENLRKQLAEAEAKLAAMPKPVMKLKITEKGQLSIAGLKPGWPITMPPDVWKLMDSQREEINKFLNTQQPTPTSEG